MMASNDPFRHTNSIFFFEIIHGRKSDAILGSDPNKDQRKLELGMTAN